MVSAQRNDRNLRGRLAADVVRSFAPLHGSAAKHRLPRATVTPKDWNAIDMKGNFLSFLHGLAPLPPMKNFLAARGGWNFYLRGLCRCSTIYGWMGRWDLELITLLSAAHPPRDGCMMYQRSSSNLLIGLLLAGEFLLDGGFLLTGGILLAGGFLNRLRCRFRQLEFGHLRRFPLDFRLRLQKLSLGGLW